MPDDSGMSTITSTDAGKNAGTSAAVFEGKASDPEKTGHLKSAVDSSNLTSAAHSFEQRCADLGGTH